MATGNTRTVGREAERLALDYLLGEGLALVARNFHCRLGEIDLVMLDRQCLVFAEVRYRANNRFANAVLTVDHRKQGKLGRAAMMFVRRHRQFAQHTMRFDVVGVDRDVDGDVFVEWIRDAFRPGTGGW